MCKAEWKRIKRWRKHFPLSLKCGKYPLYWATILLRFQQTLTHSLSQFSSVTQSCLTLCDSMDCSMPGLPVHHQLPEFTQTHIHWVGDAIQPSHPLPSPSPPAFNLSQHQGLFQWVSYWIRWPEYWSFIQHQWSWFTWVLPMNIQDWFPLRLMVWSPYSPRDSQESSPTPQFKSINFLALSFLYSPNLTSIHN